MDTILKYATPEEMDELRKSAQEARYAVSEIANIDQSVALARAAVAKAQTSITQDATVRARRLIGNLALLQEAPPAGPTVAQLQQNVADLEALAAEQRERAANAQSAVRVSYISLLRACAQRCAVEYAARAEALKESWLHIAAAESVLYGMLNTAVAAPGGTVPPSVVHLPSWARLSIPGSRALDAIRKVEDIWGMEALMHGETEVERGAFTGATRALQTDNPTTAGVG